MKKPKTGNCPECGCSVNPENLERHLRKVHRQDNGQKKKETREFSKCPKCGCSVKSENLDRHLRKTHGSGIKEYAKDKERKLSKAEERLILKEHRKKKLKMDLGIAAGIILVLVIVWFVYKNIGGDTDTPYSDGTSVEAKEDLNNVYVPVSELSDGNIHKFSYTAANGKNVRYFLVLGPDTKYHGAIDLCQKQHPGNTGWYQDGDYVVCETEQCGYPINAIGSGDPGCCTPISFKVQEVGSQIQVEKQYLEEGAKYFQ